MKYHMPSLALLFALAFSVSLAFAQVPTGTPPFSSSAGGPDVIDLANLNVQIQVPVINKPGRGGMNFFYNLSYDSSVWYPVGASGNQKWTPVENWGFREVTEVETGYVSYTEITTECNGAKVGFEGWYLYSYTNFAYHDNHGVVHPFAGSAYYYSGENYGTCIMGSNKQLTALATDGSGYTLATNLPGGSIITPIGTVTYPPFGTGLGSAYAVDRNGNEITVTGGTSTTFTDTLGTTALTISGSGTASSPLQLQYPAPGGATSYQINYTNYTVATNFGISGIGEYKSTAAVPLITSIVLPDGSQYVFQYEATPSAPASGACTPYSGTTCTTARLASVQYPTGGVITYSYSGGNNGVLSDGSAATLTRAVSPGGTWTYAQVKGSGAASTTTVTDPQGNVTTIQFQGIYETQRVVNQGSSTVLLTTNTCYSPTLPCTGTAVTLPITERNISTTLAGSGNLTDDHTYGYDDYGNLLSAQDWDFGSGAAGAYLRKTTISYASLGNIVSFPQTVTTTNATGTTVSQTTYNYDYGSVTAPTGSTPQWVSVSGSRGNLTSTYEYTSSTSTYLTQANTYYNTGTLNTSTDVNGGLTTYTYSNSTATCGNAFPTGITEAVSALTQSYTWNCGGGVMTAFEDENQQTTTTTYSDPYYWRPASITNPASAVTNFCYGLFSSSNGACAINPNQIESQMTFNTNGSSTVDNLTTTDGLGRPILQQTRQAPGATMFDTTETVYDSLGRVSKTVLPFSTTAGTTNSSGAGTTTSYDALNRITQQQDSGGGTVSINYTQNDVFVSLNAPTGENAKRRQLEYNSIGQLTSVCEVTSLTGSGSCAQKTAQTGYWTKYTYNPLSEITGVTQNAQSSSTQTRTYVYDLMGRMTSEMNPESGTTTYTYDTASACGTWNGDLVEKVDAIGNVTCFSYDPLQRLSETWYPSGAYASNTPTKYFVYDSATVNSVAMVNAKGRLAEAYTCTGSCTSKLTDEGFSYTGVGQVGTFYESTPNSGGYYSSAAVYWQNGVISQLQGFYGSTSNYLANYGLDGEGRPYSANGLQSSMIYNPASQPTQLNFTSGDFDNFTYDPNTGRMTQYQFNVNNQSVTGTLTWNSNGSLSSLAITDPFNSNDQQTCSYGSPSATPAIAGYDDLERLISFNCVNSSNVSIWGQTFGYDALGNLTQSGTESFLPSYSSATNQMTELNSCTPTYDANGNLTNDCAIETYSWDAAGHATTIHGNGVTYDALGRMVEFSMNGSYYQNIYSPTGFLMEIPTEGKYFVPLPGGAEAVYLPGEPYYYRHSDWQGSTRFASLPNRTMYYDLAYAPFGAPYNYTATTPEYVFTGQEHNFPELYDFPAREYSIQGRWSSPDPAGMSAVDPTNPQTWNRYAYVGNNPLAYIDPSGMNECAPNNSAGASNGPSCFHGASDTSMSGDFPVSVFNGIAGGLSNWAEFGYSSGFSTYTIDVSLGVFTTMPGNDSMGGGGWLEYAADRNRCAAKHAGSAANVLGISQNNYLGQSLFGNDISSISQLITGPGNASAAGQLLISNPTPASAFGLATKASLNWIPTSGNGLVLAQNGAGTYYAVGSTTTTLGAKAVGQGISKGLAWLTGIKLTADIYNYYRALIACSADPTMQ
jgi:RHS repeat-associated protein